MAFRQTPPAPSPQAQTMSVHNLTHSSEREAEPLSRFPVADGLDLKGAHFTSPGHMAFAPSGARPPSSGNVPPMRQ